jgi:hypothetical protein
MPLIQSRDSGLAAAGKPFVAYGFNYAGPTGSNGTFSFNSATPAEMSRYVAGMDRARELGANTLRIYLQLFDFIKRRNGQVEERERALANLNRVLDAAQRLGLYLDVTGNLVWVPGSAPKWYDRLPFASRWLVQARFWSGVSSVAAQSPAILCYELTSEPAISTNARTWYTGRLGGLNFVQRIVKDAGERDPATLARQWISALSGAIRRNDPRHLIGVGLLPSTGGAFAPTNVAGSLHLLLVHLYPKNGRVAHAEQILRAFAAPGKPVILGETFMLQDDATTQTRFLLSSRRYLSGFLSFIRPFNKKGGRSQHSPLRRSNLREFLSVKHQLLSPVD